MPGPIYAIPRRQNYGRPQSVPHNNFNAGIITSFDQSKIPDNACTSIVNFDIQPTGELISRPGIINSDINGHTILPDPYTLGGTLHYVLLDVVTLPSGFGSPGVDYAIYVYSNGSDTGYFAMNPVNYTDYISLNRINGRFLLTKSQFIFYSNTYYFYANAGGGTDVSFKCTTTGTGVTTFAGPTDYPGGGSITTRFFLYKDRVYYLANTRVYFSKTGSPDIWTGDPDTSFFAVGSDGTSIKALSGVRDVLYIFKEESLWALYGDPILNPQLKEINGNFGSDYNDVIQHRDIIYFCFNGYIYELINGNAKNISYTLKPFSYYDYRPSFNIFSFYKERIFFRNYVYNIQTRSWSTWNLTAGLSGAAFNTFYKVVNTPSNTYYYEQDDSVYSVGSGPKSLWKFADFAGFDNINGVKSYLTCSLITKFFSDPNLTGMLRLYGAEVNLSGQYTTLTFTVNGSGGGLAGVTWPNPAGNSPVTGGGSYSPNDISNKLAELANPTFPFTSVKLPASLRSRGFKYTISITCSDNGPLSFLGFNEIIRPKVGINSEVSTP